MLYLELNYWDIQMETESLEEVALVENLDQAEGYAAATVFDGDSGYYYLDAYELTVDGFKYLTTIYED
jgi:hypothetical protein